MLTAIYNFVKGIVDFIVMEYEHVTSFFSFTQDALGIVPKLLTYIPTFLGVFVTAFISISFIRRLINR